MWIILCIVAGWIIGRGLYYAGLLLIDFIKDISAGIGHKKWLREHPECKDINLFKVFATMNLK